MAITIEQFRASLGKLGHALSDEQVQSRLDSAYQFAEGMYEWFSERKGTGIEAITGAYVSDIETDTARDIERIKATRKEVCLLPQAEADLVKQAKQYEKRYPNK